MYSRLSSYLKGVEFRRLLKLAGRILAFSFAALAIMILVGPLLAAIVLSVYANALSVKVEDFGLGALIVLVIVFTLWGVKSVYKLLFPCGFYGSLQGIRSYSDRSLSSVQLKSTKGKRGLNLESMKDFGIARHEASHLVTALHFDEKVISASILKNQDSRGRVITEDWVTDEATVESFEASRNRVWARLLTLLAGAAGDRKNGVKSFSSVSDHTAAEKLLPILMAADYGKVIGEAKAKAGFAVDRIDLSKPLSSSELYARALIHVDAILEANMSVVDLAEDLLKKHGVITPETVGNPLSMLREKIIIVPDPGFQ